MRNLNPSPKSLDANGITDGTYFVDMYGYVHGAMHTNGFYVGDNTNPLPYDVPVTTGELFGRWTDTETGTVYWDRVTWIESYDMARIVATERGELAIWDIINNTEIRVNN